jgi:hypothetical protein
VTGTNKGGWYRVIERDTAGVCFTLEVTEDLAVPWLRRLVADLSPWRHGFTPGAVDLLLVALGQGFLRVLIFPPVSIIPPLLCILIYHLGDEQ